MKRILNLILYNCAIVVLLLLACEVGATFMRSAWDSQKERELARQTARENALNPSEAAEFVAEENRAGRVNWTSYTYWRRAPISGKYVNVDAKGIRKTWNPPASSKPRVRVFLFGGSTMWGTESRDDYTIPSQLSKVLAKSFGSAVEVVNFGETGYVQTQEVITLLKELQRGNVPNVAVFYDGYNDAFAAFQAGVAGVPQNEFNRVAEFNLLLSSSRLFLEGARQSNLAWALTTFAGRLHVFAHRSKPAPAAADVAERLAADTLRVYATNLKVLDAAGREYNIRMLYYWQPSVFTKLHLSPEEQAQSDSDPPFRKFDLATVALLKASPIERMDSFRDLSGAFDEDPKRIYLDTMHPFERGNQRIAELMAEGVSGAVRQLLR
jgi:lysophospholipase L1-like esterase